MILMQPGSRGIIWGGTPGELTNSTDISSSYVVLISLKDVLSNFGAYYSSGIALILFESFWFCICVLDIKLKYSNF